MAAYNKTLLAALCVLALSTLCEARPQIPGQGFAQGAQQFAQPGFQAAQQGAQAAQQTTRVTDTFSGQAGGFGATNTFGSG